MALTRVALTGRGYGYDRKGPNPDNPNNLFVVDATKSTYNKSDDSYSGKVVINGEEYTLSGDDFEGVEVTDAHGNKFKLDDVIDKLVDQLSEWPITELGLIDVTAYISERQKFVVRDDSSMKIVN